VSYNTVSSVLKRSFIVFMIGILSISAMYPESLTLSRYALIMGSNDGGKDRVLLRYAEQDALSFANVLKEMGGVTGDRLQLLFNPSVAGVTKSIDELKIKIRNDSNLQARKEIIVYYSGHSDEEGILLSGNHYYYKDLRDRIAAINADVRITILDSCSSGAITRTKGVIRRPAFLLDSSSNMKGYAFLTSSAENEAAQESDRIGASFFTHYLVSGLRGAADTSGDGTVTLNEAYSYAFGETLATTEKSQYGAQHPRYDIQLTGSGDLVLTDLRATSAGLVFSDDIEGKLAIRDNAGNLIVELSKSKGHKVELGFAPGKYRIMLTGKTDIYETDVEISESKRTLLEKDMFKKTSKEPAVTRGDSNNIIDEKTNDSPAGENPIDDQTDTEQADASGISKHHRLFHLSLVPFLPIIGSDNEDSVISVNIFVGMDKSISSAQVSSLGNIVTDDITGFQGAGLFNFTTGKNTGYQGTGLFNFSGGKFIGFQSAGIANIAASGVLGAQAGGITDISGSTVTGFQVSGIASVCGGDLLGVQVAGIVNVALNSTGCQAGLINIAGKVNGVQVGLVNIADRYEIGLPIGFINLEKDGLSNFSLSYDDWGYAYLDFKLGTRFTYTLFSVSYVPASIPEKWSYGLGLGVHIPFGSFYIDTDVLCRSMETGSIKWDEKTTRKILPSIRSSFGLSLKDRFTCFAGVAINFFFPGYYSNSDVQAWWSIPVSYSNERLRIAPSFFGGIQF
jgi:hypothetical protein